MVVDIEELELIRSLERGTNGINVTGKQPRRRGQRAMAYAASDTPEYRVKGQRHLPGKAGMEQ